jgi:hypothetical protein
VNLQPVNSAIISPDCYCDDESTLFDLRCEVREGIVGWLQRTNPRAL